jgi:hypothetical protein
MGRYMEIKEKVKESSLELLVLRRSFLSLSDVDFDYRVLSNCGTALVGALCKQFVIP